MTIDEDASCVMAIAKPVVDDANGLIHILASTRDFGTGTSGIRCSDQTDPKGARLKTLSTADFEEVGEHVVASESLGFPGQRVLSLGVTLDEENSVLWFPELCASNPASQAPAECNIFDTVIKGVKVTVLGTVSD